jgi:putative CocE/NonD family hydrolase
MKNQSRSNNFAATNSVLRAAMEIRSGARAKRLIRLCAFAALPLLLIASAGFAQVRTDSPAKEPDYVRSHYTKYDYRIPMRDGVRLFTSVYLPKDTDKTYPILMQRTPYSIGPYGVDNYPSSLGPDDSFQKEGFIFVYQDVRGRYESEGSFVDVPVHREHLGPKEFDEATDTHDTIDWLVKNIPGNNGRVGIWGISYPGFFAAFSLVHSHPALKAVSPQAPMGDVGNGDDSYHNGAFYLAANFGFYSGFKPRGPDPERPKNGPRFDFGTSDQYEFFLRMGPIANADKLYFHHENEYWSDTLKHAAYDEFWSSRALAPDMHNVTPAVLCVGGWYDAEDLSGPLKLFRAVEADGRAPANTLVMGPWRHGGWGRGDGETLGHLNFGSRTGDYFRENIELPFFVHHLKSEPSGGSNSSSAKSSSSKSSFPKAWAFETGTCQWRKFDSWPPKNALRRSLFLNAGGRASFSRESGDGNDFDEYVSDPAKPVPVVGEIGPGMPGDYMTADQRFASRRADVLTCQTEPLDHDVRIAGPVTAVLRVSTSGTDSDFIVKLIDVYPDDYSDARSNGQGAIMGGYQQMVRGEPFRGKYRRSLSQPEPFAPGSPVKIQFAMPDVLHVFRAGHRIMVQIQSSWFPMVDRNPQKFLDIPQAQASDFQKATQRVYRGGEDGSRIEMLVIE